MKAHLLGFWQMLGFLLFGFARGVGPHSGAFDRSAIQDVIDGDALQAPPTSLTGVADIINAHLSGNYIVTTGQADLMTLAAPTAGVDDNLSIAIFSDTLFAHTVTATALFANGTALKTTATFAAFRGAGMILRAWNGVWQVVSSSGVTFT